ncbi:condensation domain-containing protein [Actinoallomurus sp. NPDC050550]|uniref:condensation domain-containing protein n=1 Tax=Actinoallomurus sp. NPDC050550 TaxID=3154937 RepID=UPI0033E282E3
MHADLLLAGPHQRTVQVVCRAVPLLWRQVDLSGVPERERADHLDRLVESARSERFAVTKAPLSRFLLVRLAPDRHRFVICTHHAVLDGWSSWLVLSELAQLYAGGGDAAGVPEPPSAEAYHRWLAGQDRAAAEAAWRDALAGLPGPTLLAGRPRPVAGARRAVPPPGAGRSRHPAARLRPRPQPDPQHPGPGRAGPGARGNQKARAGHRASAGRGSGQLARRPPNPEEVA